MNKLKLYFYRFILKHIFQPEKNMRKNIASPIIYEERELNNEGNTRSSLEHNMSFSRIVLTQLQQ